MSSAYEQLKITDLHAYYGESHILHGLGMHINRGELVTLLGRNGSGRSTTLKSIMNMVGRRTGSIVINGNETIETPPHHIARLGVGYCPEASNTVIFLVMIFVLLLRPAGLFGKEA